MPLHFFRRLRFLWRQHTFAADLTEELEFHRVQKQKELEGGGIPSAEAEMASRRSLGNRTLAREDARAVWAWAWLDGLCRDLSYALRSLRRHPGFFVVAVVTLALGVGVTNAVFSVLYAVVINPFIAGDTSNSGLQEPPQPAVYVPLTMMLGDSVTIMLRTPRDPMAFARSIREAVHEADPGQPVNRMRTAEAALADAGWARERFVTLVLVGFGVSALILAAVGLYSFVSFSVTGRNKEFGIRRALGAGRAHTMWLACGSAIRPIAAGLAAGGIAIAGANRIVAQWSIGDLSNPVVIASTSLVVLAVVTAAALIPASRATKVDPMVALRCD